LSLFYTALDRRAVEGTRDRKDGPQGVEFERAVSSDRLGGAGSLTASGREAPRFEYILHGSIPNAVLVEPKRSDSAALALARATALPKERVVFGRPIGKTRRSASAGASWMELEAADLVMLKRPWQYDHGLPCAPAANAAKYLAPRPGFKSLPDRDRHPWRLRLRKGISRRTPISAK